jgi:mannose-6-phosphate isomerase-like protein (cupin superfamily)
VPAEAGNPETLTITPHESVTIRSSTPEALELEATYAPDGSAPPKHWHPEQDEHFEVLEGRVRTRVEGDQHDLGPGEEIDIPRRSVHQMWNPGSEPARVLWRTSPAGRTEQWFRAIDRLHREGRVGSNGMPGPLAFGVLLTEYRDVFRLAAPEPVIRPAMALLGVVGRAKGYRA